MSSTVISGRFGSVNGISQIQNWSLDWTTTDNAHANSFTVGGKQRDEGVNDWQGTFNSEGAIGALDFNNFSFSGRTGAAARNGTGTTYSGDAVITGLTLSGDITSGGRVLSAFTYAGNGILTKAAGASSDSTTPSILLAKQCTVTWNDEPVNWQQFSFAITNEAQTYVGSDTVISGVCWTKRYPGLMDWTGNLTIKATEPIGTNGTVASLKITCGSQDLLEFEYARLISTTGITADPSSGALVGYTVNYGMCAHDDSGTLGSIKLFGNTIWPESAS